MDKKELNNKSLRWDPYLLISGEGLVDLWQNHFQSQNTKVLFIMGKGFDVRMNFGLESLMSNATNIDLEILLINFNEGRNSPSKKYKDLVDANENELSKLVNSSVINNKSINLWEGLGRKKRRIGDRKVSELFQGVDDIISYSDIIVDISALPRGIYFTLIGKLLKLIDHHFGDKPNSPNLFVLTTENADIDSNIIEEGVDEDLHYPLGFGGGVELESLNLPIVWLPLLGESKNLHFDKANLHIRPDEICPLLPFPSKNPRRSDNIFKDHHELLFDVLRVESQNIMYAPEQNPFEVYRKLVSTIRNYQDSLSILHGCKTVISTFSSKLLSIGAVLTAYEFKEDPNIHVGILNVDSQGYNIKDVEKLKLLRNNSEIFVSWLTGKPYENIGN